MLIQNLNNLYISGVDFESIADGTGCRTVIFISGCSHHCHNCHSPDTHNFTSGEKVTPELIEYLNTEMKKRPFLSGISLSGGDPMDSANLVNQLLEKLYIPKNNIWCYTGYTYEQIINDPIKNQLLQHIDTLVDSPYIDALHDASLKFKGSSNQRIINVKQSIQKGKIVMED